MHHVHAPETIPPVPDDTVAVARAAVPKGNVYLQSRDTLGSIYQDEIFVSLFSRRGQPAQAPWQLALVCAMQFMENLSDRQAADAVRARIDWKYALSLPLSDPGFDYSILSEFHDRLIAGNAEQLLLDKLLEQLREKKLLKGHKRQRTDSTHVLGAIRSLNRLETLGETFRTALNNLTVVAPDWLQENLQVEWFDRYSRRTENYRLPKQDSEREELGRTHQWAVVACKAEINAGQLDRGSQRQRVMERRQRNHGAAIVLVLQHDGNLTGCL